MDDEQEPAEPRWGELIEQRDTLASEVARLTVLCQALSARVTTAENQVAEMRGYLGALVSLASAVLETGLFKPPEAPES